MGIVPPDIVESLISPWQTPTQSWLGKGLLAMDGHDKLICIVGCYILCLILGRCTCVRECSRRFETKIPCVMAPKRHLATDWALGGNFESDWDSIDRHTHTNEIDEVIIKGIAVCVGYRQNRCWLPFWWYFTTIDTKNGSVPVVSDTLEKRRPDSMM